MLKGLGIPKMCAQLNDIFVKFIGGKSVGLIRVVETVVKEPAFVAILTFVTLMLRGIEIVVI